MLVLLTVSEELTQTGRQADRQTDRQTDRVALYSIDFFKSKKKESSHWYNLVGFLVSRGLGQLVAEVAQANTLNKVNF